MGHLVDGGARALFAVAVGALAFIAVITVFEVASRYLFGAPTVWVVDATGVALAWSIVLAAPRVALERGHVAITMLGDVGPGRELRARLIEAVAGLVCAGAAWIVASEAWRQFERGITTQGAMPVPKVWITVALAVGLGWTALVFVRLALGSAAAAERDFARAETRDRHPD